MLLDPYQSGRVAPFDTHHVLRGSHPPGFVLRSTSEGTDGFLATACDAWHAGSQYSYHRPR